jgi:hypothetical protein
MILSINQMQPERLRADGNRSLRNWNLHVFILTDGRVPPVTPPNGLWGWPWLGLSAGFPMTANLQRNLPADCANRL